MFEDTGNGPVQSVTQIRKPLHVDARERAAPAQAGDLRLNIEYWEFEYPISNNQ